MRRVVEIAFEGSLARLGADLAGGSHAPAVFDSYGDLAVGMLRQAQRNLLSTALIMEYEPPDTGVDERISMVRHLRTETNADIKQIYVTRAFSRSGELTLIHGALTSASATQARTGTVGAGVVNSRA